MAKFLYQGHGSFRLITKSGKVIYVDPFAGSGYDLPADLILITHGHFDHIQHQLCAKKPDYQMITHGEALAGGRHNSFEVLGLKIQAVTAGNKNHDPKECVGYIIELDGVKLYASGDTSLTGQMKEFAALSLDYALFPGDGKYNMDIIEAAECARIVGAKHNILVHTDTTGGLLDLEKAKAWSAPNKLIVKPGEEIEL